MALRKNPKLDLRRKYRRTLEISMIIVLCLLIAAFKFVPELETLGSFNITPQDIVVIINPPSSGERFTPPPPPEPLIPVEAPEDIDLPDDIEFSPTELVPGNTPFGDPPEPESDNSPEPTPVFVAAAEVLPEPVGGIAGIQSRIKYPEFAVRAGIEGIVSLLAYVDEDGNVVKVDVVRGLGAGCDEEAIRAVMATKFKPGKQRGRAVKVKMGIPVRFKLK